MLAVTGLALKLAIGYVLTAAVINGVISVAEADSFGTQVAVSIVTGLISAGGVILGTVLAAKYSSKATDIAETNQELLQSHEQKLTAIEETVTGARTEATERANGTDGT